MSIRVGGAKEGALPTGVVRVLVVGDSGVGKSSLVHLIVNGVPISSPRRTVGCNVSVKYLEYHSGGMGLLRHEGREERCSFFVELWDVSGNPQFSESRSIFYQQINGVIGVHDLSQRKARSDLHKWTAEVASQGTFSAPSPHLPIEGNLPVPLLIIGNKADAAKWDPLKGRWGSGGDLAAYATSTNVFKKAMQWLSDLLSTLPRAGRTGKLVAKVEGLVQKQSFGELPRVDSGPPSAGLIVSAKHNRLDMAAVNGFFYELIRRRYFAAEAMRTPSPSDVSRLSPGTRPTSDARIDMES